MYRLIFLSGKNKGRRLAIQQGNILVGRDPECHIQLKDDDEVSRRHAILREQNGTVLIEDAGALNKILVNRQEVRQASLKHGDVIELGRTRLMFHSVRGNRTIEPRSLGFIQRLTIAAVILIMIMEFAYLAALALWHNRIFDMTGMGPVEGADTNSSLIATLETSAPPAEVDMMSEAEQRLQQLEQAQADLEPMRPLDETESADMANELKRLKADVENIKEQVQDLNPAPTEVPATPIPSPATAPATPAPGSDPVLKKAEQMLQDALLDLQRMNLTQADQQLERIQVLAPDYLPAYMERARLYERRGKLKEAGEQWTAVMNRGAGTKVYEQAAAERIRVSRAEMIQTAFQTAQADTDSATRLQRRVRIDSVEPQKFPGNDQFDEMRLLRITLKPRMGEKSLDVSQVLVVVNFFDQGTKSGEIFPSEVLVPKEPLFAKGEDGDSQRVITAAYVVPKDYRKTEKEKYGEERRYYGYVVRVIYDRAVQDEDAKPRSLLKEPVQLPDPTAPQTPSAS